MNMENPLLSIVITSFTMERFKGACDLLDSIKAQTYPNIEVLYVVERSTELYDQVKAYAEEKAITNLKVLFNDGEPGASAARNLGIKNAKGELIAFSDDDVVLFPNWAEKMVETYTNDKVIAVTGPIFPLWEDSAMSWFPEELNWIVSCTSWFKPSKAVEIRHVWISNACFRREAFELAGFLDTKLGPQDSVRGFKGNELGGATTAEDEELCLRIRQQSGKQIIFNPTVKVWHRASRERIGWKHIIRWSYWIGLSRRQVKKRYSKINVGTDVLSQEHQLLRHVFTRLFPNILKNLFKNPVIAWRQLSVTMTALFFVALGYYNLPLGRYKNQRT